MKKNGINILIFVVMLAIVDIQPRSFSSAPIGVYNSTGVYNFIDRAIEKAGYGYAEDQKKAAQNKINQLEAEMSDILYEKINETDRIVRKRQLLPPAQIKRLEELKNEIYQLKLITGAEWSTQRKVILGALALAGVAALGYGAYKYAYQLPAEVNSNDISALTQRLKQIEEQEYVRNPLGGYMKNPAFNEEDARKAREALNQAIGAVPYHSPDLVDLQDLPGLQKRYQDIEAQQYISGYSNPNFNEEDYSVAMKQYGKGLDLALIKNAAGNISQEDLNKLYAVKKNMKKVGEIVGGLEFSWATQGYTAAELESPSVKLEISQKLLETAKDIAGKERLRKLLSPGFSKAYEITINK